MAQTDIDIDFYIHGVPTSFSSWGTCEENSDYLKKFYGGCQKENQARMFVEYQKMADRSYRTYYSYILDANVKNNDLRDNSYIGLTICIKKTFCNNVRGVYQLLEYTFNTYIVGRILQRTGDTWKYDILDFRNENATMKQISNIVFESFRPLINSCIDISEVNMGDCPKLDLYSYDDSGFLEKFKQNGQFIVSPFYESLAEKRLKAEYNEKIETINKNWATDRNRFQQDIQKEKEEKAKLNNELEEMKKKYNNATADNQHLKSENQKYKDARRMEEILQSREFKDLANLLRSYAPRVGTEIPKGLELPPKKESKKIVYTLSAGCVLFLVISGILGWQLYDAHDMLAKENEQNKRISSELSTARTTNEKLRSSTSFRKTGTDYSIDIAGGSAPLKANATYTLKALNSNGNGFWQVIGANVETKNLDKQSVIIIPKEKGQITVRYFIDNEYFERNIKVE